MEMVVERRGQTPLIIRQKKKQLAPVIEEKVTPVVIEEKKILTPRSGAMITKDMIGRNFRYLGRNRNTIYHVDVDKNVYSEELGKIFYVGMLQNTPLEAAIKLGKYRPVFQVHDWAPSIFRS